MVSILQSLSDLLQPSEAEAKVLPLDKKSADTLQSITEKVSPGIDNFTKVLYQTILQKAQEEPATVTMSQRPVLGGVGEYLPGKMDIGLSQSYYGDVSKDNPAYQNTISHELLHFLLQQYGRDKELSSTHETRGVEMIGNSNALQHNLIKYILGNDKAPKFSPYDYSELRPLDIKNIPRDTGSWQLFNPAVRAIMKKLFSGTPLQHGVIESVPSTIQENR